MVSASAWRQRHVRPGTTPMGADGCTTSAPRKFPRRPPTPPRPGCRRRRGSSGRRGASYCFRKLAVPDPGDREWCHRFVAPLDLVAMPQGMPDDPGTPEVTAWQAQDVGAAELTGRSLESGAAVSEGTPPAAETGWNGPRHQVVPELETPAGALRGRAAVASASMARPSCHAAFPCRTDRYSMGVRRSDNVRAAEDSGGAHVGPPAFDVPRRLSGWPTS